MARYFQGKIGRPCSEDDLKNYGSGAGKEFQHFSKACPAFAAEIAALAMRKIDGGGNLASGSKKYVHWGPLKTRKTEVKPECNTLLLQVQQAVDASKLCPRVA